METIQLSVGGMRCGGCVKRVTTLLDRTPGVSVNRVEVGSAVVSVETGRATIGSVISALNAAGYEARPAEVPHERR